MSGLSQDLLIFVCDYYDNSTSEVSISTPFFVQILVDKCYKADSLFAVCVTFCFFMFYLY